MKVVLPWPDPRLFPNYKRANHWRKFRSQERDARALGWGLAMEALSASERKALAEASYLNMEVAFFPPDHRKRDDDGMIGAIKNARDGIADALGVDDRRFRPTYRIADPEKPGRVEIIFAVRACEKTPKTGEKQHATPENVVEEGRGGECVNTQPAPDINALEQRQ